MPWNPRSENGRLGVKAEAYKVKAKAKDTAAEAEAETKDYIRCHKICQFAWRTRR